MKKKVIIIGGEHARWPLSNAEWFEKSGFDVHVVFFSDNEPVIHPPNVNFLRIPITYSLFDKITIALWALVTIALSILYLPRFIKKTGRKTAFGDLCLANNIITARKKAKLIDKLNPYIIVGHNIAHSGLAIAMTHAEKRILMGWSGDVSEVFYASPVQYQTYKYIVKKTDLFIAGSDTALHIFAKEFGIEKKHFLRTAWQQKNIATLLNYDHGNSMTVRKKYNIPENAKVVFHARRFKPQYWAMQGFDACLKIAKECNDTWFIFIEGTSNKRHFNPALKKLSRESHSISSRFIMLSGEVPFNTILDLFSISDIFLSLRKRGDMRSATVIQGAAMGCIPVLAEYEEWETLIKNGFHAILVDPDNLGDLIQGLHKALGSKKEVFKKINDKYLRENELDEHLLQKFSKAMNQLVNQK